MTITPVHPDDLQALQHRVRTEPNAKARDRCRCVLLAIDGLAAPQIAERIDRSRSFVQRWCYAYRDHGLDGLEPKAQSGRPHRLATTEHKAFKQRILDGPTDADGVCALRGVDAQRILQDEFGVNYSLNGVYKLLHQLNLSVLVPRPEHRKADPQAMAKWVKDAPFLSNKSGAINPASRSPSGSRTKLPGEAIWVCNSQQGTLTRVWAERGRRPRAVRQTEYQWAYVFGAVDPVSGKLSALISPTVNTKHTRKDQNHHPRGMAGA